MHNISNASNHDIGNVHPIPLNCEDLNQPLLFFIILKTQLIFS